MSSLERPILLPGQSADGGPDYLRLPSEMHTYTVPDLGDGFDALGFDWLARLADIVAAQRADAPSTRVALDELTPDALRQLEQLLGRGEVAASVLGKPELQLRESVFTGLWRVRAMDPRRGCIGDVLEAGSVPDVLRDAARAGAGWLELPPRDDIGGDVGNAPHLLAEVLERSRAFDGGGPGHVFNLDLLPLAPADQSWLVDMLGSGPVVVVSEGYGATRIRSTRQAWTWWVQYYNSSDAMILNTLEIAAVPTVACAADDDLADSAQRLRELLDLEARR